MFIDCKWVATRWQWSFNMLHMHGLWRLIFFLLALQPPLGVVFYSPLAGFSLLAYEVS